MVEIKGACLTKEQLLGNNNDSPCVGDMPSSKAFPSNYIQELSTYPTGLHPPEDAMKRTSPASSVKDSFPVIRECASCGHKIWDKFLLHAMEKYWHTECLKCSCCHVLLCDIGNSCFSKAGMVLCKNDYLRLFGKSGKCTGCGNGIPANEMVMKIQGDQFYHVNCFTCVVCQHRLVAGDRFSVMNGCIVCELDYPKVIRGLVTLPTCRIK